MFLKVRIKKTISTKFGEVTVSKNHLFEQTPQNFRVSPYLQELVVFTGQNMVYQDASEQLERSNSLTICPKQIERITDRYGELSSIEEAQVQEYRLDKKYEMRKEPPFIV